MKLFNSHTHKTETGETESPSQKMEIIAHLSRVSKSK